MGVPLDVLNSLFYIYKYPVDLCFSKKKGYPFQNKSCFQFICLQQPPLCLFPLSITRKILAPMNICLEISDNKMQTVSFLEYSLRLPLENGFSILQVNCLLTVDYHLVQKNVVHGEVRRKSPWLFLSFPFSASCLAICYILILSIQVRPEDICPLLKRRVSVKDYSD